MKIEKMYKKYRNIKYFDIQILTDWERVKDKLTFRLVNAEKTGKWLKKIPYRLYLDLAVVYYISLDDSKCGGQIFVVVTSKLMKQWNMDEDVQIVVPPLCNQ